MGIVDRIMKVLVFLALIFLAVFVPVQPVPRRYPKWFRDSSSSSSSSESMQMGSFEGGDETNVKTHVNVHNGGSNPGMNGGAQPWRQAWGQPWGQPPQRAVVHHNPQPNCMLGVKLFGG